MFCSIIKSFESSLLRSENGMNSDAGGIVPLDLTNLTASDVDFLLGSLLRAESLS